MVCYLEQEEKRKVLPLYQACFDDTKEYCKYYFQKRLPQNEVAVCEEIEGETRSGQDGSQCCIAYKGMIHLIPKTISIQKSSSSKEDADRVEAGLQQDCGNMHTTFATQCHYLYAVATSPAIRRQGVMGRILRKVLLDLYERGELFTYLIPSSEENAQIYRKYGFARVMDKYMLKEERFRKPCFPDVMMRRAEQKDIPALSEFAQHTMACRYSIYIGKNRKYFEDIMELMKVEGGEITLYEVDGKILGYRIGFADDVLEEVLHDSLEELSWASGESKPYTMARILHIPQMLEHLATRDTGHIYIEVTDSVIEENNGVFLWKFGLDESWEDLEHKRICNNHWKRVECQNPDVSVTIEEFTAHLMGYERVEKLPVMDVKQGFYINDYV